MHWPKHKILTDKYYQACNYLQCKVEVITVAKRNYFTGYGILLHELAVVVVLFTQSNNNEWTMKHSILYGIFCRSLFRTSRLIVKLEL